ncbi:helix-turn-helix domain-containing protein [Rhodococcus aetherivorans]|uniref:helix-turn-helix domain-containing protein n=1 Tax=Rhodococcus aetherivorans TaxID=191292 RepID=UPI0026EE2E4A|nr:helix-turn-helix domain-containing protein [Rhodococcus aetherivorans]MDV6292250.1 helix-turn-helix domain-containing protein [Rhodococcus aetherivorans]WKX00710.1 helix-turn-helix domain-containing protein [Rhodococcus aetherivorans]
MPSNRSDRRLVSLAAAAAEYGVHPRTIRRRISDGTITGYKLGRLIRVDPDEVAAAFRPMAAAGDRR